MEKQDEIFTGRADSEKFNAGGITVTTVQPMSGIRKQGAWGLWWLTVITFGIYYLVWYDRIGGELAATAGVSREAWTRWWSQLIPIYGLIGLSRTAKRLNQAHTQAGSSTRVSPVVTWLWAPIWFGSHTRYLQRRINILVDIYSSRATAHAPA